MLAYRGSRFSVHFTLSGAIWRDYTANYFSVDWCPEPPEVNGGVVTITGRRAGSTATYSCQNGFILFGDNVSPP